MKKNEFKALDMIRRIRDEQNKILQGKSNEDIKVFYSEKSKMLDSKLRNFLTQPSSKT